MTRSRPRDHADADVRVVWDPGSTGDLVGTCRCGARFRSPDPRAVWNWYAAHRHGPAPPSAGGPP